MDLNIKLLKWPYEETIIKESLIVIYTIYGFIFLNFPDCIKRTGWHIHKKSKLPYMTKNNKSYLEFIPGKGSDDWIK